MQEVLKQDIRNDIRTAINNLKKLEEGLNDIRVTS
jgi:hypothetical protein